MRNFDRAHRRCDAPHVRDRMGSLMPLDLARHVCVGVRADRKKRFDVEVRVGGNRRRHRARRLAGSDDVERNGQPQLARPQCTRERTTRASAIDRRTEDGQQIVSERAQCARQWALCGSDQADNLVTTSNSRNS